MKKGFLILSMILSMVIHGQNRSLNHSDYDSWNSISNYTITNLGDYTAVVTSPQRGDGFLSLIKTSNGKTIRFERSDSPKFTADGKWLIFRVTPPFEEVYKLKLKDTPKDEMPKNKLVKYEIRTGRSDTVLNLVSFNVHPNEGAFVSVFIENEKREEKKDSSEAQIEVEDNWDAEEKHGSGFFDDDAKRLLLWNLTSNHIDTILRVSDVEWAEKKARAAVVQSAGDSTQPSSLWGWYPDSEMRRVDSAFEKLTHLKLDENGSWLGYLCSMDSSEAKLHHYDLKLSNNFNWAEVALHAEDALLQKNWMISEFESLIFTEDGKSLFLGTRPVPFIPEEDTLTLDEEKVQLDIWSWTDVDIQPMQKLNAKSDAETSYTGRFDLETGMWIQLEDEDLENVRIDRRGGLDVAVGYTTPDVSKRAISWKYPTLQDFYIINLKNGQRTLIASDVESRPTLSPEGKYVYWWDSKARNWKGYSIENSQDIIFSANIPFPVYDEENDIPSNPGSYGSIGWSEGDEAFYFYDAYDIWKVIPGGSSENVTRGEGRKANTRIRYQQMDRNETCLPSDQWILHTMNETDKSTAYVELNLRNGRMETLVGGDYSLSSLFMADSAEVYFYRKETFNEYPEIYSVRGDDLEDARKLTCTNPQQSEFRWGNVELVEWTTPTGIELQGLLYKPSDFDASRKYPVLVYFYETYSDQIHKYYAPAPSASVINFPYFLSNEYIVFIPDVVYEEGHPGKSAEDCILSGADMVARFPFVDASRMAIQGQSWGGYQVAHLVTRTDQFACAMAGAPVSNMTSAYGGIRWGSGMSRAFQYENTQSRIGGTLWDRRDLYIENSPVFYADRVETPLLIMHNDGDGAVPWYQGIEYFMALRRLDKPVWMLVYNNEEHNLMKRHNRMDLSIRMAQFFDHYLKGAPAPEWLIHGRSYNEKSYNPATNTLNENE